MNITKVYNHNTVGSIMDGCEVIVTGSGIGFQKKAGEQLDQNKIEKIYAFSDRYKLQFLDLVQHCPYLYFQLSGAIMNRAEKVLGQKLRDWFMISVTDHIYYAVERTKKGIPIPNLMLDEIRTLYLSEYKIGLWAIKLIHKYTGMMLNAGEAGYIAIHIVNALQVGQEHKATQIMIFSNYILRIIEECFGFQLKKNDVKYSRLMIHLKFLAQKVLGHPQQEQKESFELLHSIMNNDERMDICIKKITNFVQQRYHYELLEEDQFYLMVHLMRIL